MGEPDAEWTPGERLQSLLDDLLPAETSIRKLSPATRGLAVIEAFHDAGYVDDDEIDGLLDGFYRYGAESKQFAALVDVCLDVAAASHIGMRHGVRRVGG